MAREFVMGARLSLRDTMSGPLQFVRENVARAAQGTNVYKDANGRLRDEMGRFIGRAQQQSREMKKLGEVAGSTKDKVMGLKDAIVAVAAGATAKKGFDWLISGNAEMEQYQNTLAIVLKDQKKAADTLSWATKFAADTPFEVPEIVEATVKLSSYGLEAQKVLGVTGDMAAVMGKSMDQAVEAIADAQTGELERMKEFGITKNMIVDQAKKLGSTVVDSKGSITDQKAFNAALFSLMEERYKGGMEVQSKTFKGMLSNASDFIGSMGRELGKPLFDKLKNEMAFALGVLDNFKKSGQLQAWINNVGGAFNRVKGYVTLGIDWIRSVYTEIKKLAGSDAVYTVKTMGAQLTLTFQRWYGAIKPILDWLAGPGFGNVKSIIVDIAVAAIETGKFIADNWGVIEPILIGVGTALLLYKGYLIATAAYTKVMAALQIAWNVALGIYNTIMAGATARVRIATAAQLLWNAALSMNPIGLIIAGVALLIAGVILLVRHWDRVRAWLISIWAAIKSAAVTAFNYILDFLKEWGGFLLLALTGPVGLVVGLLTKYWDEISAAAVAAWNGITDGLSAAWDNIKGGFKSGVNFIVGLLNDMIDKINAALSVKLPDWMGGKEFKVNIPHIPTMGGADGSHATGLNRVPFDGYKAELHEGERVLTKAESNRYDTALGFQKTQAQPAQKAINIEKLVETVEIHAAPGDDGEALYAKFIDAFHRKAKDAVSILSTADMGGLLNGAT